MGLRAASVGSGHTLMVIYTHTLTLPPLFIKHLYIQYLVELSSDPIGSASCLLSCDWLLKLTVASLIRSGTKIQTLELRMKCVKILLHFNWFIFHQTIDCLLRCFSQ